MPTCTIQSDLDEDGNVLIWVDFAEPLYTGQTRLPVTTVFTTYDDEVDVSLLTKEDDNPLSSAYAVCAGPDARGDWYTIELGDDFHYVDGSDKKRMN